MSDTEPYSRWHAAWLASAWLMVGAIVYLSLARLDIEMPVEQGDKIEHVVAYAALGFWFMQVYTRRASRAVVAAALIVLGIGLEFLQGQTGYRHFDYADMIANTIGVLLGWLASPPRTPSVLSFIQRRVSR